VARARKRARAKHRGHRVKIDLNADVGEGADDLPIIPLVTSISVACGAHAGDEETMRRCIAEAKRLGVAVGAHPGYPDREGFGRRRLQMSPDDLAASLTEQIRTLAAVAAGLDTRLSHVKPHGALYNAAAADDELSQTVVRAVRDTGLRLFGLAGSRMLQAAQVAGVPVVAESFADRRYLADGTLAPRDRAGALIEDPQTAARQALALALGNPIETADGGAIRIESDTICLHADTPGALAIATAVREALDDAGVEVAPLPAG
jgi:5-oxoprolinase (ATP-hydrolysing) subunit A